jgi:asparagine synthase (glutamine-hydrolysing)
MCGIAGILAPGPASEFKPIEADMARAILYRGRDRQGRWSDDRHVTLLHSRLSVIDLSTGDQPMTDLSGRFVIVFNGEIYNYVELRKEYEQLGSSFRTQSDTEVILEGYRLKGADVCRELNGMFAFAIWDRKEKVLFLARDHLGKKPLYWCRQGERFYFASSTEAFRSIRTGESSVCLRTIQVYALLGFFPEGSTIYSDVYAFPAGCCATVCAGTVSPRIERYWRPQFREKSPASFGELVLEYEHLLTDAICIRLRSDVPLALTFSGGVDSGTIAAICTRALGITPRCYTIDYHTAEDFSEETYNAERVARQLGLDWQYIHFDYRERLLAELDDAYRFYDQPCTQIALVYSSSLYNAIKPYATVVLSGNGADELFTGYKGDERTRWYGVGLRLTSWLRPLLPSASNISPFLRLPAPKAFAERAVQQARVLEYSADSISAVEKAAHAVAEEAVACGAVSLMDFKMYASLFHSAADSNFRLPDISGLAAQVEVRSPFLDFRLVEFAAKLPDRYKVGGLLGSRGVKLLPKSYYARHVSKDVAWSSKKGMGYNLRWGMSAAVEPEFISAFGMAYDALDAAGVETRRFRTAWRNHQHHMKVYGPPSPYGDVMMTGFMLGRWLLLRSSQVSI